MISEFKGSLAYRVGCRTVRVTQKNFCLEKQNRKKKISSCL